MTASSTSASAGTGRPGATASWRRRRYGALALSAALHLVFAFSIFASAKGVISGGMAQADYSDAVEVSLSGREGARSAPSDPRAAAVQDLFRRARAEQSDVFSAPQETRPRSSLSALFDEIQDRRRRAQEAAEAADGAGRQGAGREESGSGSKSGPMRPTRQGEELSDDVSSGELWGQVEPCWRKAPNSSSIPVSLDILLNDKGALDRPPTIIRPANATLDERRLIAEARALAAIAACMPYHTVSLPGMRRAYRVDFVPGRR